MTPEEIAAEVCGFEQVGEIVTLKMTRDDYDAILIRLGLAAGAAFARDDKPFAYRTFALLNRLNRNNPNYAGYEVPPEFEQ